MNAVSSKLGTNTPEEEALIQRGIDMDPDTYVLSEEEFRQLRPFVLRVGKAATGEGEAEGR